MRHRRSRWAMPRESPIHWKGALNTLTCDHARVRSSSVSVTQEDAGGSLMMSSPYGFVIVRRTADDDGAAANTW